MSRRQEHFANSTRRSRSRSRATTRRDAKVLVLLVILLPSLIGITGLVIDAGLLMSEHRVVQHAADAGATAAALDLKLDKSAGAAASTAEDIIVNGHQLPDAAVSVNSPPASGEFAGRANYVEVSIDRTYRSRFMRVLDGVANRTMGARAVAGFDDATADAAIVVLDPEPADLTLPDMNGLLGLIDTGELAEAVIDQMGVGEFLSAVPVVGGLLNDLLNTQLESVVPSIVSELWNTVANQVSLPIVPTLTAGMEVEGLGRVIVDGAVLVNCKWGGEDENGQPAGIAAGPPYGLACMPLLPTTRLAARDIRVVGGVDSSRNYEPFEADGDDPLQANRLAVPDPFEGLPIPSVSSDPYNASSNLAADSHTVRLALPVSEAGQLLNGVLGLVPALLQPLVQPLLDPLTDLLTETTLQPGVYDSITVLSPLGGARFEPGIYIIRNTSPITQMSLCIIGPVQADGVLFYITDSNGFDASSGSPDANDDDSAEPANPLTSVIPSTLVLPLLATANIRGLDDPSSPFDDMLIYQRPLDRRPIVIEAQQLLGTDISGTVYAKWAHVIFVGGNGTYDMRFVSGTLRMVTAFDTTIAPSNLLPAAQDVYLVE